MEPYYELAYALESKSICLFVGTGFSMHITDSKAPSWLKLLEQCAMKIKGGEKLVEQLFPNQKSVMPLEECASIIQVRMQSEGKCLHTEIAKIIRKLNLGKGSFKLQEFVERFPDLKFITTNYDELIEKGLLEKRDSTAYSIGYPVNRQPKGIQIYHVHGSIKHPKKMIVTADDYFRFINKPDYFSKKVQTLIEENTTVIIGYSLGDINFRSILNNQRSNRVHDINRQNLFFLSRSKIDQNVKDYYDRSYGLRVIDNTGIDDFITEIIDKHESIKERVNKSKALLIPVLEGKKRFTDLYLKKRDSFFEIVATLSSNGILISHPDVMGFIKDVLKRKDNFTSENGAWEQYVHLADWLIHLGEIMDIKGTDLEGVYLSAVNTSFNNMSKEPVLGRSWNAFSAWKKGWYNLTYDNREMIIEYFKYNNLSSDGAEVIR
ncbi:SIR2 family NAD-dependent protein deacylase [Pectobacterium aroidearum]|uniref:SIR2 family NAD-dependent protein deacylase n=1 Tax=Pectobacterium aroidearum TaxID=1201031 RepID=UPI001C7171A5|nr:SIR2 family protein [Pectobacterium aroidearum]